MKRIILYSVFILLSHSWCCKANVNLKEFTCSIVDTSRSETEQAKAIYDWITTHIKYDLKAFLKLSPQNQTPEYTIKTGKGLCTDYANLMTAMCRAVGIESYTVYGYTKGYKYYKGKVFLHSDHSWNVIRADSVWILTDATWGSGYISYKSKIVSHLFHSIGLMKTVKQKPVYIQEYNSGFFNIKSRDLLKTHYPLDPKWLIDNNIPLYKGFESGIIDYDLDSIDWNREIEKIKEKAEDYQKIADATTACELNNNNYFDIGLTIYQSTLDFDTFRVITNDNIDQFIDLNDRMKNIDKYYKRQLIITDSVYSQRFNRLKEIMTSHIKVIKSIEKSSSNSLALYKKNKNTQKKKSEEIYNKIARLEKNIRKLKKTHLQSKIDSRIQQNHTEKLESIINLVDAEMPQPWFSLRLDSINEVMDMSLTMDAIVNDSIATVAFELTKEIKKLNEILITKEESTINYQFDLVLNKYWYFTILINKKILNSNNIKNLIKVLKDNRIQWQDLLKKEQLQLKYMYQSNTMPDAVYDIYENSLSENISLFEKQIVFENRLLTHLAFQQGFRNSTRSSFKAIKKLSKTERKQFEIWYSETLEWEKANYKKDKEILSSVLKDNQLRLKSLNQKLKIVN